MAFQVEDRHLLRRHSRVRTGMFQRQPQLPCALDQSHSQTHENSILYESQSPLHQYQRPNLIEAEFHEMAQTPTDGTRIRLQEILRTQLTNRRSPKPPAGSRPSPPHPNHRSLAIERVPPLFETRANPTHKLTTSYSTTLDGPQRLLMTNLRIISFNFDIPRPNVRVGCGRDRHLATPASRNLSRTLSFSFWHPTTQREGWVWSGPAPRSAGFP